MLEIIKEAGTVLKDLPDLAIWILVGVLLYKVFIIGGFISVFKFTVNKVITYLHNKKEIEARPKTIITKYEINKLFIDDAMAEFEVLLDELRLQRMGGTSGGGFKSDYIHRSDITFLRCAMAEKKEREGKL